MDSGSPSFGGGGDGGVEEVGGIEGSGQARRISARRADEYRRIFIPLLPPDSLGMNGDTGNLSLPYLHLYNGGGGGDFNCDSE